MVKCVQLEIIHYLVKAKVPFVELPEAGALEQNETLSPTQLAMDLGFYEAALVLGELVTQTVRVDKVASVYIAHQASFSVCVVSVICVLQCWLCVDYISRVGFIDVIISVQCFQCCWVQSFVYRGRRSSQARLASHSNWLLVCS